MSNDDQLTNVNYWEATEAEQKLVKDFVENKPLHDAVKKHMLRNISRQVNIFHPQNHWIYSIDRSKDDVEYAKLVKLVTQAQQEVADAFEHLYDVAKMAEKSVEAPVNEAK